MRFLCLLFIFGLRYTLASDCEGSIGLYSYSIRALAASPQVLMQENEYYYYSPCNSANTINSACAFPYAPKTAICQKDNRNRVYGLGNTSAVWQFRPNGDAESGFVLHFSKGGAPTPAPPKVSSIEYICDPKIAVGILEKADPFEYPAHNYHFRWNTSAACPYAIPPVTVPPIPPPTSTEYDFTVKYLPGSPDGYPRPVIGVFDQDSPTQEQHVRPFPGPLIHARKGEIISVNIRNHFDDEMTSVHFHGLHQFNNAWMDGTFGVTECGIQPFHNFTYKFELTQTGTYWYHSHVGAQYGDGLLGPLVIEHETDDLDPIFVQWNYSAQYVLLLQDWFHDTWEDILLYYLGPFHAFPDFTPRYPWPTANLLINGRGNWNCSDGMDWSDCQEQVCYPHRSPFLGVCRPLSYAPEQYICPPGDTLRIRIINGANNAMQRFWIDRHNITLVARDGIDIAPMSVEWVIIPVSQRIDAIVKCDQDPCQKYYIFTAIPPGYGENENSTQNVTAHAFLSYPNTTTIRTPLYPPDSKKWKAPDVMFGYNNLHPATPKKAPIADERIFLYWRPVWDQVNSAPLENWVVNKTAYVHSLEPILQTVKRGRKLEGIIAHSPSYHVNASFHTNVIQLQKGKTYEIVVFGDDYQSHPWHLHGYSVEFIQAVNLTNQLKAKVPCVPLPYGDECYYDVDSPAFDNLMNETLGPLTEAVDVIAEGDSFIVPGYGISVFRFRADNPGPWFFHCHVDWHLTLGQAVVLSVGTDDHYSGIDSPPSNFVVCGIDATWGYCDNPWQGHIIAGVVGFVICLICASAICAVAICVYCCCLQNGEQDSLGSTSTSSPEKAVLVPKIS